MTIHLGNVPAGSTLYVPFASYDSAGASVTLTGLSTADILIYKNGSTTERASTAGFTLLDTDGIDFDGKTGINAFSVDLSDNTDASFYAVGSFYWIIISSVTIDGETVNLIAATFRIVAAESSAGVPKADVSHVAGTSQTGGDIIGDTATIKAKTNSLTFTTAGQVDANVQYVNDVQVTGNGQADTPWGPA